MFGWTQRTPFGAWTLLCWWLMIIAYSDWLYSFVTIFISKGHNLLINTFSVLFKVRWDQLLCFRPLFTFIPCSLTCAVPPKGHRVRWLDTRSESRDPDFKFPVSPLHDECLTYHSAVCFLVSSLSKSEMVMRLSSAARQPGFSVLRFPHLENGGSDVNYSAYFVPAHLLSDISTHLTLTTTLWGRYYYSHFSDDESDLSKLVQLKWDDIRVWIQAIWLQSLCLLPAL